MNTCPPAIQALVEHLAAVSASRSARQQSRLWAAAEPILDRYSRPADVAAAIRSARPAHQDELVSALIGVAAGDELAQLTVVAGLSRRLGWIVTGWRRAGVPQDELRTLEADLVAECWAAVASLARKPPDVDPPSRAAMWLVQTAWQKVRGPRRRQRRLDNRRAPLPGCQAPAVSAPAGEELTAVIVSSVRSGRMTVNGARLVFATRVAGWSVAETAERLGCSPQSVRTRRARAEHRLTAA